MPVFRCVERYLAPDTIYEQTMTIVASSLTFPPISWWAKIMGADALITDTGEQYQKMTYRNRYRIAGANNSILLSVPLVNGRNQRIPLREVEIHNGELWQVQHWRTLVSAYKRSPYFEFYENSLSLLYERSFNYLADFNHEALYWVMQQLKLKSVLQRNSEFVKEYPEDIVDIRNFKEHKEDFPRYYQVFEDRLGFLPDLSILDLLFSEGPATKAWLEQYEREAGV
jgi:hypothetical protein